MALIWIAVLYNLPSGPSWLDPHSFRFFQPCIILMLNETWSISLICLQALSIASLLSVGSGTGKLIRAIIIKMIMELKDDCINVYSLRSSGPLFFYKGFYIISRPITKTRILVYQRLCCYTRGQSNIIYKKKYWMQRLII